MALLSNAGENAVGERAARGSGACAALLLALLCASAAHGQQQATEVSLKSAFLYKFVYYAAWPPKALGTLGEPIAICVIGQDELAQALEGAVRGRVSHERPVIVRRVESADDVGGCHVLFVGWSAAERLDLVISRVSAQRPSPSATPRASRAGAE